VLFIKSNLKHLTCRTAVLHGRVQFYCSSLELITQQYSRGADLSRNKNDKTLRSLV